MCLLSLELNWFGESVTGCRLMLNQLPLTKSQTLSVTSIRLLTYVATILSPFWNLKVEDFESQKNPISDQKMLNYLQVRSDSCHTKILPWNQIMWTKEGVIILSTDSNIKWKSSNNTYLNIIRIFFHSFKNIEFKN